MVSPHLSNDVVQLFFIAIISATWRLSGGELLTAKTQRPFKKLSKAYGSGLTPSSGVRGVECVLPLSGGEG